jgi:hypothetical protein
MRKRITKRSVEALRAGDRPDFLWATDVTGLLIIGGRCRAGVRREGP